MSTAKLLAMALGLIVAVIGILGLAAPATLLEFGRSLHTTTALYVVAALRVMFGAILLWVAPVSRTPRILRALGIFLIIAGVITPLFGIERSRAMLEWWSAQGSVFARAWALVAVALGLFIVYAVDFPRRSVSNREDR